MPVPGLVKSHLIFLWWNVQLSIQNIVFSSGGAALSLTLGSGGCDPTFAENFYIIL